MPEACPCRRGYDSRVLRLGGVVSGVVSIGALLALASLPAASSTQSLAPYVATPDDVVDRMLVLAQVTREDVVYDLGCGDGRIPIAAAKKYGARGAGLDLDPKLIAWPRQTHKRRRDALVISGGEVSRGNIGRHVVTLYLLSSSTAAGPCCAAAERGPDRVSAFSMGGNGPAEKSIVRSARGDEVTCIVED